MKAIPGASRFAAAAWRSAAAGLVVIGSACATAAPSVAPYQVVAGPSAPPAVAPPPASVVLSGAPRSTGDAPPTLSPTEPSIVGMPSARITVAANGEDVSEVIGRVAQQVGLRPIIDPAVRGPVRRNLRNVSLNEAMLNLIGSRYQYRVQNGTLVVSPVSLVQHTYTVDYLTMSRVSSASTVVARGTQGIGQNSNQGQIASPVGTGIGTGVTSTAGGLVASGSDVITSSSSVDVWTDLAEQLESILFQTSDSSRGTRTPGSGQGYRRCATDGTCLRISPLTSLVDITATPEKHEQVSRYIALYKAAIGRQVLIKAQVVEVSLDRSHSFGIDWQAVLSSARNSASLTNAPATFVTDAASSVIGNMSFNLGVGDFTLKAVLNALQTIGEVNVVANPMTNAMNQQKASFNVTRQQQFFTTSRTPIVSPTTGAITGYNETTAIQTATVGLVFDVLPQISDKNIVMMAIRPSVTSLVGQEKIEGVGGTIQAILPVTDHRETDTMARVRSGETIMIGGLIQRQTTQTRSGVPGLMNIPWLGRLFSKTTMTERTSELVIFLTPEIVSGQVPGGT